ncbi:YggS family pyridoxal phosphate-dependent enzyme [Paludibacterium sp. THUN1379]|uniref:YggS family pyridoxal phosphate-dependent enzyme n=1 Tax=Paludibacterium sp. THUN1379 TaxID=3112107 RepID=UPI00308C7E17|nr:YggS family pyridoxal phosphate-dependent enzyme [Paludibacterium sp. THUN1379]
MSQSVSMALDHVRQQIRTAESQADRPAGSVRLIAVSKTFPADAIRDAVAAGQQAFGENYVQEFAGKAAELTALGIEWHFIGPIQSNKTRIVAEYAHWVHSVDRIKIAERLSAQRPAGMPPLNVCLQVNVSGEDSKSGCAPADLPGLAQQVATLPNLRLRGLMCIPEPTPDSDLLAARFRTLRSLRDELNGRGLALEELSMGMSSDMVLAVQQGATMVRVGTAIFGARDYSHRQIGN